MAYLPPSTIEQQRCLPTWSAEKRNEFFTLLVPMLGLVAARLGIRGSTIDDVVQETITRVIESADRYDCNFALQPWVYQIARHVVFGVFRDGHRAVPLEDVAS